MIPANGAPHDLEARDVLRSFAFAQRRARDNSTQIGASPSCRFSCTAASRQQLSTRIDPEELLFESPGYPYLVYSTLASRGTSRHGPAEGRLIGFLTGQKPEH